MDFNKVQENNLARIVELDHRIDLTTNLKVLRKLRNQRSALYSRINNRAKIQAIEQKLYIRSKHLVAMLSILREEVTEA